MTKRLGVMACSLLIAVFTSNGSAQNATTSLRGVVRDPSGALVPGATITLSNQTNGTHLTTTSRSTGEYELLRIVPARYIITVAAAGFSVQSNSAELLVNQPATVNFTLTINARQETLDVTSTAQGLNTTNAALGSSKDNATIQALPSETRNPADLLSLEPGVLYFPPPGDDYTQADSRLGAVNGGRSDQGNITVDGVDDNDEVNGFAFFTVLRETQDSIEEFNVTTGDADADEGRSSGAQVSLVTKTGTNKFHGSAYEYFRPSNTVANDWFNKQAQLQSGEANRPPKLIRNIFGVDLGGPVAKNKLFFFFNYEGQRQAESQIINQTVPCYSTSSCLTPAGATGPAAASYDNGYLVYKGDIAGTNPATTTSVVLSPANVTTLDAKCSVCSNKSAAYPYSPGPGPNPYALAYLKSMPTANSLVNGDLVNTGGYVFASPNPISHNTTILKIDWTPSERHHVFAKGQLQKDLTQGTENFPGQGPSYFLSDNSKGMTFGDTWTIASHVVNDLRYEYVRQGNGDIGVGNGNFADFSNPGGGLVGPITAETDNLIQWVPVNNIVDNLNWTKGKHDIQVGFNWRLIHQNRLSNQNSFNNVTNDYDWYATPAPSPSSSTKGGGLGLDRVDAGFTTSYDQAYLDLVGSMGVVTNVINYQLTSPSTGALQVNGANLERNFAANEYEGYIQDAWHIQPSLTLTFGLRYTVLQTPYETKGQEVAPTIDTDAYYKERESAALAGQVYEPNLEFVPAGKFYHAAGFWPKSKNNVAPRVAFAYSPDDKTSIRAGAGIYYDHYGEALVNTYDQNGAFGLSSYLNNPADVLTYANAPRYTSRGMIPTITGSPVPPTTNAYPYTYPTTEPYNFSIQWGLDNKMKTPYTEAFDLSFERELPSGFMIETNYVGRMGRHLLQSLDLDEPVDYVDPEGGGDYYSAATQLSKLVDANNSNPDATVPAIQYFEDVFPFMASAATKRSGAVSATQNIYTEEWAPNRALGGLGETGALADIDFYCSQPPAYQYYNCPAGYQSKFWSQQFSSLYALATVGMSYYNALQVSLRHPTSHGLEEQISYVYSKSIDMGSDAERASEFSTVTTGNSSIINTFNPALNRGLSDFDTKHAVTANFVYQIPVGKGKHYLGTAGPLTNALLGGWQIAGIYRWTSGLPFSFFESAWTTDYQINGYMVNVGNVKIQKHIDSNGEPQYVAGTSDDGANAINSGVNSGSPMRDPYPGEAGQRNNFRGDGYFETDSALSKSWAFGSRGNLKFAWEIYNATNSVRFDPLSIDSYVGDSTLGQADTELTNPRRMQFSLRYDF